MNIEEVTPPRKFCVGLSETVLEHCGNIWLDANQLVTFYSDSGAQYDVTKKEWGYYATPSTNGRLLQNRLRAHLVQSKSTGHIFVILVELGKEAAAREYAEAEQIEWLRDLSVPATDNRSQS